ncbi:MAG: type II secretion system F family protein [Candidatus Micrarchaeota archaeon]
MNKPVIPFSVLPPKAQLAAGRVLKGFGNFAASFTPFLADDLTQAEITTPAREYLGAAIASAAVNAVVVAIVFALVGSSARVSMEGPAALLAIVTAGTTLVTSVYYPKTIARRRSRRLELHLIPAARQLLIELRSGVPLFHAMASVSDDYGGASEEFKKIVQHIDAGVPEVDALAEAARANPSLQFKKLLWQLSNALKVGSDLGDALEAIIKEFVLERVDQIRRYGQELSPWTLVYMMAAVVVPSLGITLLIVIGSFIGIVLPNVVLAAGLAYLVVFQLFFMNFIGTRRPVV